jgi:hypothetical protein
MNRKVSMGHVSRNKTQSIKSQRPCPTRGSEVRTHTQQTTTKVKCLHIINGTRGTTACDVLKQNKQTKQNKTSHLSKKSPIMDATHHLSVAYCTQTFCCLHPNARSERPWSHLHSTGESR